MHADGGPRADVFHPVISVISVLSVAKTGGFRRMGIERIGEGVWCVSGKKMGSKFVLRRNKRGEMRLCA
jgi:hypothetical protein